jgi:beta-mannanase
MTFVKALATAACTLLMSALQANAQSDVPKLGVYDPHGQLRSQGDISIEHVFVSWQTFRPEDLRLAASDAKALGRQLMITVEPWTRAVNMKDGRATLLSEVAGGGFDREITSICQEIGATGSPIMVSWGHEMDEMEGRFPWANHDPTVFQKAYRHFVDQCRQFAPAARFGWTPKGEQTMGTYYPGSAHVDYIGLTLFDVQSWNRDHRDWRTLDDKFGALHSQIAGFGKTVVLAEFGVEGDEAYRQQALACARDRFRKFPNLEAIVYFNDRETWRWPEPYGRPDWRIADLRHLQCEREEATGRTLQAKAIH